VSLYNGDCFEVMQGLPDNSVDLVLTDPPYGLAFMGKKWDYDVPRVDIWAEALRVLKPGGHVLAFAGTRTQHRMACNIEDAGFEIRDMLAWVYGSGFPKSLDVSKAIDKAAGIWRGKAGDVTSHNGSMSGGIMCAPITSPATDAAREWAGYGTALKPALEPITMARKPIIGTVAGNVMQYGTGALNIDACRVGTDDNLNGGAYSGGKKDLSLASSYATGVNAGTFKQHTGRWPANLLHDGSDEVLALFPMTGGGTYAKQTRKRKGFMLSGSEDNVQEANAPDNYGDSGSAARFFYCAKASKRERDEANTHPTVKPIALMEYLVQLASHPGAVVLDPFMGSGTTGIACRNLGREFIGIERDADYFEIAKRRIEHEAQQMEPAL